MQREKWSASGNDYLCQVCCLIQLMNAGTVAGITRLSKGYPDEDKQSHKTITAYIDELLPALWA